MESNLSKKQICIKKIFTSLTTQNGSRWSMKNEFKVIHIGTSWTEGPKRNCTHVWKIHEKTLKIGVFPIFEGVKDENVFFSRAKLNPWRTTFLLVPLVLWNIHKLKYYKQLYVWLNLLSHIWLFEPIWKTLHILEEILQKIA